MRAWIRATAWPVSGAPATVDLAQRDARCPARWREPASPASARYRARGCLKDGEAAQRNVVAAAVHARRGGLEPCRLCVALRRDERWEVITQEEMVERTMVSQDVGVPTVTIPTCPPLARG
jgi:hypothetical protein